MFLLTSIDYTLMSLSLTCTSLSPPSVERELPPGVSQKEFDLYNDVRERAAQALNELMNPTGMLINVASSALLSPTSMALAAQERCPAAIEFGKWDIDTWYSSPFPQEYAR